MLLKTLIYTTHDVLLWWSGQVTCANCKCNYKGEVPWGWSVRRWRIL